MVRVSWFNRSALILALSIIFCSASTSDIESLHETNSSEPPFVTVYSRDGDSLRIPVQLQRQLQQELETWHWRPWKRTHTVIRDNYVEVACLRSESSASSFPPSIFTYEQLRDGAFMCYVLFGVYAFTLLAVVCNDYFLPCVEMICEDLKIPQNVAAATFMSVATSCPEFFVNVISTFLTESDMGVGTIVGSAIFNALGVAAIGGLAAVRPIAIEKRPVTRDVIIYLINVSVLVAIVWDGEVVWYEAVVLGVLYVVYFIVMFNSTRLFAIYDRFMESRRKRKLNDVSEQITDNSIKSIESGYDNEGFSDYIITNGANDKEKAIDVVDKAAERQDEHKPKKSVEHKPKKSVWRYPRENSVTYRVWWVYTWPIKFLLSLTIPSMTTNKKYYPLAFIMCIVWIGVNSYFVSWCMTVIGDTWLIPDSVMGMTFLAFGGCLPEACSIFIMSRKGEGGIGVSNALGANSLAILFALGVPWLIKTLVLVSTDSVNQSVIINSEGIGYVMGSLLIAVVCLYITIYVGKFMLRKSVGAALSVLYVIFITFAVLAEIGIIFDPTVLVC